MKIALFSDTYAPDINGVATSTKILRNALIQLGHDVLIVTTELPSDSVYIDSPSDNILRVPGVELSKLYGYRACKMYSFKGMKEIKQFGTQLIHCQTEFGVGIFSRIVAQSLDIPIIYTYHTMWSDYSHYLLPIKSNMVDSLLKKMIQRFSAINGSICTELIVPSSKTALALKEYGLKKEVNIIPTGLELKRFDPKYKNIERINEIIKEYNLNDKFVLTFLGRIGKEKNIDMIINALKDIDNDFVFLIVGGGPYLDELKSIVRSLGMDNVIFTGPKDPYYVPDFYHVSDIFISASLSETQGLTFIEAMATGTPVLAHHDKNLEGVIHDGNNGFFFNDECSLKAKLSYVMKNDLSKLSKQALQDANEHSSDLFAEKVVEVYKRALLNNKYTYEVIDFIHTKNNKIDIILLFEDSQIKVEVNDLLIEEYDLYIGKVVDREIFDLLKANELISVAYSLALSYLSRKDYTEKQLIKKISLNGDFSHDQLDKVLIKLKEKKLINDYQYSIDYIHKGLRTGIGINKCIYNLNRLEVSKEILDQCLQEIEDGEEFQSILRAIEKLENSNKSFSYKMMLNRIKQRLYNNGYRNDTIEKAMNTYEFTYDQNAEKDTLKKDFDKALMKYKRKVSNKDLNKKLINVLLKKGYNYENISELIVEMEDVEID